MITKKFSTLNKMLKQYRTKGNNSSRIKLFESFEIKDLKGKDNKC